MQDKVELFRNYFNHRVKKNREDIMPHCTNCDYKWKANEVLALGFSRQGKDCANCENRQYMSSKTQRIFTLGYLSLLIVPFLLFCIKLSDKEESLF